jgi:hypothetical protein
VLLDGANSSDGCLMHARMDGTMMMEGEEENARRRLTPCCKEEGLTCQRGVLVSHGRRGCWAHIRQWWWSCSPPSPS